MEQALASSADAELILKLYELRTEPVMRTARRWMVGEFWPSSPQDVFTIASDPTSQHNAYFRQVHSYWEMAASFVLHGALNGELFLDCNTESLYLYAKFKPLLGAIRERQPGFMRKTEQLIEKYPSARQRVEQMEQGIAERRAAIKPPAGTFGPDPD